MSTDTDGTGGFTFTPPGELPNEFAKFGQNTFELAVETAIELTVLRTLIVVVNGINVESPDLNSLRDRASVLEARLGAFTESLAGSWELDSADPANNARLWTAAIDRCASIVREVLSPKPIVDTANAMIRARTPGGL